MYRESSTKLFLSSMSRGVVIRVSSESKCHQRSSLPHQRLLYKSVLPHIALVLKTGLQGFNFVSACGGVFTGLCGVLKSPGYPTYYPNNAHCTYDIHVPKDMRIVLVLHLFDLESCCDKLLLTQVVSGMNEVVAELSGSERIRRQYISVENRFTVLFTSDGSVTRGGFRASYFTLEKGGKFLQYFTSP